MMLSTVQHVSGASITKNLGMVSGVTVRAPTFWNGIKGSFAAIIGGKIHQYTAMCEEARKDSFDIMIRKAEDLGANAIIGIQFDTSQVTGDTVEVFCFGTAVELEKN